jgi:hypothetical protein
MLSRHEEQNDRLEVLENEKRLRASTLSQFAQSEAAEARGRFTAHEQSTVVGGSAIPKYPAAYLNHDPVPQEPSVGYRINDLNPTDPPTEPSDLASAVPPPSVEQGNVGDPALSPVGSPISSRTYRRA